MSCCGTATPTTAGRFFLLFHFVMMILVLIFHQASHIFNFVESQAFGFGGSCLAIASLPVGAGASGTFQRTAFDQCLRDNAAWYLIFGEAIMFLGCMGTALAGPEAAAHALGAWLPVKLVLPVVLCFVAITIPTQLAYGTSQFGAVCALPVLVAVGVAVADRGASAAERLNNANFAQQRATLNFNAPSSQRRLHIVLAVASLLTAVSFAVAQLVKYQLGHQIAATVVSILVVLVATVMSVFPSNRMSILSSGIVGVYVMTCNWLALLMDTEANIPSNTSPQPQPKII